MARDLWQTVREAVEIDRINKRLTIPAGTFNCGPENGSIKLSAQTDPLRAPVPYGLTLSTTTITVDFYFYLIPLNLPSPWSIIEIEQASGYGIKLTVDSSFITLSIKTTTATYAASFSSTNLFYGWVRYTIVTDTANNRAYLYLDGVLALTIVVVGGNFSTNTFNLWFGEIVNVGFVNGYLRELALYTVAKDAIAVSVLGTHKGTVGTYSGGLAYYWKLTSNRTATVGGVDLEGAGSLGGPVFSTTEYPRILYGASFVPVEYDVSLSSKCSFLFPVARPEGLTGMLVVRWLDDDGNLQRRRFWDLDGVDVNPLPATYAGEAVSADFTLELWNIDGEATVVIPEDLVLSLSLTTAPTTSYDQTQVAAQTLTADTTLAQNFPFTPYPLTFNSQQTY